MVFKPFSLGLHYMLNYEYTHESHQMIAIAECAVQDRRLNIPRPRTAISNHYNRHGINTHNRAMPRHMVI